MSGDDFLTLVRRHRVPDGHAVGWQVQAVGAREWIILRERIGKRRDRLSEQVENRLVNGLPQWTR